MATYQLVSVYVDVQGRDSGEHVLEESLPTYEQASNALEAERNRHVGNEEYATEISNDEFEVIDLQGLPKERVFLRENTAPPVLRFGHYSSRSSVSSWAMPPPR